ncbi:MAG TPA: SPFH domain-containing protein [Micropepsaceae bacterium]
MAQADHEIGGLGLGSSQAYRFVTRLLWLYGGFTFVVVLGLVQAWLPVTVLRTQAQEAIAGGGGGLVLATLLMALTGLFGAQLLAAARQRHFAVEEIVNEPAGRRFVLRQIGPGIAARQGQAFLIATGAALTCFASWLLWPMARTLPSAMADPNLVGAIAIALAFCSLIGERMMAVFPVPQMPEATALRRLLLVTTILLAAAGALEIGRGAGQLWVYWIFAALSVVPWIVTIELALRALARLFLPVPQPLEARAAVDSIFLGLVTGGPRAPGMLIREHLGLDFTRSWALSYLTSAALPAVLATALLCWGLSGLKLIDISQRGIYERFGAPVAVLGPGIHLLLPWPLGIMRPVEYGTLHEVKVGSSVPEATLVRIDAEAVPPPSTNHLWDTADPAEAEYLVASQSGAGVQGFQVVDAEIHVVYRTGLSDADAMAAVYGAADPGTLVGEASSRVVSMYFASHTLDTVMGAQRDMLAELLRANVAREVAAYHAGLEILSLHIESVHPPVGAAAAYHAVQAAEINANASVFNETGRAKRMAGVAQEEAHQMTSAAEASAEEKIQSAKGETYQFAADRKAYAEGKESFVTERTFQALVAALSQVRLTIIDNRLTPAQAPIIDMRGGNAALPAPATAPVAGSVPGAPPAAAAVPPPARPPAPEGPRPLTPGVEDAN